MDTLRELLQQKIATVHQPGAKGATLVLAKRDVPCMDLLLTQLTELLGVTFAIPSPACAPHPKKDDAYFVLSGDKSAPVGVMDVWNDAERFVRVYFSLNDN